MLSLVAHGGPIDPSELWSAWSTDPLVWLLLVVPGLAYLELWRRSGRRDRIARWHRRSFLAGLAVAAVALVSPVDAMGRSLSSAHMVQHLLLTTVAAPLLVLGVASRTLLPGTPGAWRRAARRHRGGAAARLGSAMLAHPVVASVPYVVALWAWHARGPYEAALERPFVHSVEHACFVATALLSWAAVLAAARRTRRAAPGIGVLVLFGLSVQSGLLGVLLTFAPSPWYPAYTSTTEAWGLDPLTDQQLAGVIMWVPGGGTYLVVALALLIAWIGAPDRRRGVSGAAAAP